MRNAAETCFSVSAAILSQTALRRYTSSAKRTPSALAIS